MTELNFMVVDQFQTVESFFFYLNGKLIVGFQGVFGASFASNFAWRQLV